MLPAEGDVRRKQGQTRSAFENYFKALECALPSYIKMELSRIILEDMYKGSRRATFFAKKADATEFLNVWLDKYKSQENIRTILDIIM